MPTNTSDRPETGKTAPYAEWQRQRGCDRKKAWPSETLARNFATLRTWAGNEQQHPYACRYCDGWHLTSAEEGTTHG